MRCKDGGDARFITIYVVGGGGVREAGSGAICWEDVVDFTGGLMGRRRERRLRDRE